MNQENNSNRIFLPTDISVIILLLVFSIYSFLNIGKIKSSFLGITFDRELVFGFIFLILIVFILYFIKWTYRSKNKLVRFIRIFYIQASYLLFFSECILLSQLFFNNHSLDFIFAKADFLIFHYQPSVSLYKVFENSKWVNELFFFSYFFYYFLITSGWWFLYFRGKEEEAIETVWTVSTSFFILYMFYSVFPVKGPKFYFPELHNIWYNHFEGYFFTNLMKNIFNNARLGGAAFPSSHVAISLIALFLNRKYNKYLIPIYFPFTITLLISTVYLYAHYFVDVLGGVFIGIFLYYYIPPQYKLFKSFALKLDKKFEKFMGNAKI